MTCTHCEGLRKYIREEIQKLEAEADARSKDSLKCQMLAAQLEKVLMVLG